MSYPIPDLDDGCWHACEIEVEKSRFIAWLCHAPTPRTFEALLARARQTHPSASHHCSAYIAGPPGEQQAIGFSDDGEPGGTAGRPMFQVLDGAGIGQVGCVVTRYFGGTKLGTGGLARAYAQAVAKGLEQLPQRDFIARRSLELKVDFASEAETRSWLTEHQIPVQAADYQASGVALRVGWPVDQDQAHLSELASRLKGRLSVGE
ncbi:uncharacterized protein, YigZ family [Franzmannia pantelleriensis]|uniref:Uncharacterized protein, YigZ family n=1 Tax=Franzmannia pantelleriensis TaxID=48727 RepID=A0A1G9Q9W8_9GAMM|nr:YigZ family protein [Halomonas pantelleriensis]SDM07277.1 uncharacterized protein, YigZ family [Halomonas pantelleriensis]